MGKKVFWLIWDLGNKMLHETKKQRYFWWVYMYICLLICMALSTQFKVSKSNNDLEIQS